MGFTTKEDERDISGLRPWIELVPSEGKTFEFGATHVPYA